jgi:hypothetical protein
MFTRRGGTLKESAMTQTVNTIANWRAMARPQSSRICETHSCGLVSRRFGIGPSRLATVAGTNRFLCVDLIPARRRVTPRSGASHPTPKPHHHHEKTNLNCVSAAGISSRPTRRMRRNRLPIGHNHWVHGPEWRGRQFLAGRKIDLRHGNHGCLHSPIRDRVPDWHQLGLVRGH